MNYLKYNTGNHDLLECSESTICDDCRAFLACVFVSSLAKGCSCVKDVVDKWELMQKATSNGTKDLNEPY